MRLHHKQRQEDNKMTERSKGDPSGVRDPDSKLSAYLDIDTRPCFTCAIVTPPSVQILIW